MRNWTVNIGHTILYTEFLNITLTVSLIETQQWKYLICNEKLNFKYSTYYPVYGEFLDIIPTVSFNKHLWRCPQESIRYCRKLGLIPILQYWKELDHWYLDMCTRLFYIWSVHETNLSYPVNPNSRNPFTNKQTNTIS